MIIDLILDRKHGVKYNAKTFYNEVMQYGTYDSIADAMDSGTESDVKKELKKYLIDNDYNLDIANYIDSVNWLDDDDVKYTTVKATDLARSMGINVIEL